MTPQPAAFSDLIRGRTVLGLGAPTHGTAEAFTWKAERILELAHAGRLGTLAWEVGYLPGLAVDAAIRGRGDLLAAIHGMRLWCWQTGEVLDLLRGLQRLNARRNPQEQVRFLGVDVQDCEGAAPELMVAGYPVGLLALQAGELTAGDPAVAGLMDDLQACLAADPDPLRRREARQLWRYLDAYLRERDCDYARLARRDRYMADTLLEHSSDPSRLTALWAHNEHVAVNPDFFGGPAAGFWLRQALGQRYAAVGMLAGEGSFASKDSAHPRPRPTVTFRLPPPAPHLTDAAFLGQPSGLYSPPEHAGPRRFLGTFYSDESARDHPERYEIARPADDFDVVLWLPRSRAATPLASPG